MAADPQRLEQLNVAGAFCLFDNKLRSSGKGSIIWGALNLLIGGVLVARNEDLGFVSVVLGLALIIAGIYERRVRDPKVIIVSAVTLAVLAIWNFTLIGLAAMGRVELALGGRTLFWAIAQTFGAYATWKTYSTYKMLLEKADPLTLQQVREYIEELNRAKAEHLDLIQFEVNAGFTEGTKRYRLKPMENLYLVARYKSQLGSLKLEDVSFAPRSDVTVIVEGEKWMSKKMKATVQLGSQKLDKVSITPDMVSRINPATNLASFSST
ncbi:MAG: hypothetical protein ABSD53_16215 [Terriglobales bacterium]|jgi:hypothetical protein